MPKQRDGPDSWRNPKWLLALALAAAALLLPRAARLNTYLGSAFLTARRMRPCSVFWFRRCLWRGSIRRIVGDGRS